MKTLSKDLACLRRGDRVLLHPKPDNQLHQKPVWATYSEGYFFCDGTSMPEGPDYYFRDVLTYNYGWEVEERSA